ncbi:hypothetical protein HZA55_03805 [Candidatus Poribacteria bacterium]|nr:hypothetical protein [Candidatus Poribacteria bacterium]
MPLDKILEKIKNEYASKVSEIEASCNNKVTEIETESQNEIQEFKTKMDSKLQSEIAELKKRSELEASLYRRNILLLEKQNKVSEVFAKVLGKIINMSKNEYLDLIKKMLSRHLSVMTEGQTEIFISINDKDKIDKQFIDSINNELKNKNIFLKLGSEYAKISGGFILKKEEIEINESLDVLFKLWKKEFEMEVAKILFS